MKWEQNMHLEEQVPNSRCSQPWRRPPLRVALMLQPGSGAATVPFFGTLMPLLSRGGAPFPSPESRLAREHAD